MTDPRRDATDAERLADELERIADAVARTDEVPTGGLPAVERVCREAARLLRTRSPEPSEGEPAGSLAAAVRRMAEADETERVEAFLRDCLSGMSSRMIPLDRKVVAAALATIADLAQRDAALRDAERRRDLWKRAAKANRRGWRHCAPEFWADLRTPDTETTLTGEDTP